jgi:hypothetical protein
MSRTGNRVTGLAAVCTDAPPLSLRFAHGQELAQRRLDLVARALAGYVPRISGPTNVPSSMSASGAASSSGAIGAKGTRSLARPRRSG